ncbi:hypothetical protein L6164_036975 [Bauhinia variegata]|uniref:Uncharacterized protein n=1 Tax=Bauhinia variegata TaxID=167791 RepID=A0ACB9KIT6_BAUVA|nr:hypothetical protein L6164_036975 [Bauhinia variegata]
MKVSYVLVLLLQLLTWMIARTNVIFLRNSLKSMAGVSPTNVESIIRVRKEDGDLDSELPRFASLKRSLETVSE